MMETSSEYWLTWLIYLLAVLSAQFLCWRITRPLPWADLRLLVQIGVFAVLITPARLDPNDSYWVPAFMAALMDGLNYGSERALDRLWPILAIMLLLVLGSVAWKFFRSRQKAGAKAKGSDR